MDGFGEYTTAVADSVKKGGLDDISGVCESYAAEHFETDSDS